MKTSFFERKDNDQVELGNELAPKFDEKGLIPCITVDDKSGEVLMFAWMNGEALSLTIETRKATYFSRSRNKLWVKGESSGLTQVVKDLLVDCDQDVIQLRVEVKGEGTCHQGFRSCFYRRLNDYDNLKLERSIKDRSFDPNEKYGSKKG